MDEAALTVLGAKAAGRHTPRLYVLSAPSGTGKDTVLRRLRERDLGVSIIVPCTTRARRPEEREGVDYRFLGRDEFVRLRDSGELLEHAEYSGQWYGTPRGAVREALARGEDVMLKIEVQGGRAVKREIPETVLIFLAPPDLAESERRLRERGVVDPDDLRRRMDAAQRELAAIPEYDYLVVNHSGRVDAAVEQIESIIRAERCRVHVPAVRV
jgi:guanylate kinase